VFPYEKGELLAVWRAALKTEGRAGGLHKKAVRRVAESGRAGCRKGQPSGPPFSVGQLNVQPAIPPFCAARQPMENSCFSFGNTALQPARPAGPPFSVVLFWTVFMSLILLQQRHGT